MENLINDIYRNLTNITEVLHKIVDITDNENILNNINEINDGINIIQELVGSAHAVGLEDQKRIEILSKSVEVYAKELEDIEMDIDDGEPGRKRKW